MAAYLLSVVFPLILSPPISFVANCAATMLKQLMHHILFSTGLSSSQASDDDFFNEPSTMRPQMTAAAAKDCTTSTISASPQSTTSASTTASATTYAVIARDVAGASVHYAASSA
ncbi:hypothetical protein PV08_02831 [Exophiala spinifera]|uniref:Secreted protein n=1 Tax=Exophiala spinifera TaxID=91928 RepID=A0A0D2BHY9_9EURO|nr:uncharacterized protein PV08_02831 [Exophiala spinifera]KIW18543.1 hypothetical protein PV08_02831 [Exophiala spinifera]